MHGDDSVVCPETALLAVHGNSIAMLWVVLGATSTFALISAVRGDRTPTNSANVQVSISAQSATTFLTTHCVKCHNWEKRKGKLAFHDLGVGLKIEAAALYADDATLQRLMMNCWPEWLTSTHLSCASPIDVALQY